MLLPGNFYILFTKHDLGNAFFLPCSRIYMNILFMNSMFSCNIDNSSNGPRSMVSRSRTLLLTKYVRVSITLLFRYTAYLEVRSVRARFSQGYLHHPMVDLVCPPPIRHLSTFPVTDNIPYRHCKN